MKAQFLCVTVRKYDTFDRKRGASRIKKGKTLRDGEGKGEGDGDGDGRARMEMEMVMKMEMEREMEVA